MRNQTTDLTLSPDNVLYFPLKRMSRNESIFSDKHNGIFSNKYEPIFRPIINKQLSVNIYYQNDLIAPANTPVSIALLIVFDELKINFKVNRIDITHEQRDQAFGAAMAQIIAEKKDFLDHIALDDTAMMQETVNGFITHTINSQRISLFNDHLEEIIGYLEFAASVITSDGNYIYIASALKKIIENEKHLFKLGNHENGETVEHIIKTAWLSLILAKELGNFSREDLKRLSIICLGHDAGKALMPKEIIYKNGRLSQLENDIIKSHVLFSYILSSDNQNNTNFESIAMAMHHIKENKRSPQSYSIAQDTHTSFFEYLTDEAKLTLEKLYPLTKPYYRIISITDTFEAITAERVYKKGSSIGKTLDIMIKSNQDENFFYKPYLDTFVRYILKQFIPKNLKFEITDEILDNYLYSYLLTPDEKTRIRKKCEGVVINYCSDIEDPLSCYLFEKKTLRVKFKVKIPPMFFLKHMYIN